MDICDLFCHKTAIYEHIRPRGYKTFSCSTQLNMIFIPIFILLTNVKMPTSILTFISRIHTLSESYKARKILFFQHYSFHEQLKFHAQLS